ncbi:hypothetical protein RchiOBHm_Chr3g0487481 [Rosa chinensis]|uniref:Uncharacterized protein n=1 Tax=Rosa chinensis TaxID=74649 RepID=A0A2P6RFI2_ROSCH|nr:hypothetical protein RchiOBHm_Chr3g0487481 [Rosa chinensis]
MRSSGSKATSSSSPDDATIQIHHRQSFRSSCLGIKFQSRHSVDDEHVTLSPFNSQSWV